MNIKSNNSNAKRLLNNFKQKHNLQRFLKYGRKNYTLDNIKTALNDSLCYSDVVRKIGMTTHGSNIRTIQKIILKECLDISHFDRKKVAKRYQNFCYNSDTILIENCTVSRAAVKKFIIDNNLIEYKCEGCNITNEYNKKLIILTLEHKNGISNDNRIENLSFLCPNCHSQTDTFCGRNKK